MAFDINKEEIRVVGHRSDWIEKYRKEAAALSEIFSGRPVRIEHIGSTAVPGLMAKPIIDIAIKLEAVEAITEYVPALTGRGYIYFGEFVLPRWHYLCRGDPRDFNLHVVDGTTEHWDLWIRFRDILLCDPRVRGEYQSLKTELARKYRYERQKYTDGKADFVNKALRAGMLTPQADPDKRALSASAYKTAS